MKFPFPISLTSLPTTLHVVQSILATLVSFLSLKALSMFSGPWDLSFPLTMTPDTSWAYSSSTSLRTVFTSYLRDIPLFPRQAQNLCIRFSYLGENMLGKISHKFWRRQSFETQSHRFLCLNIYRATVQTILRVPTSKN